MDNTLEQGGLVGELWMKRRGEEMEASERAAEFRMCEIHYLINAKYPGGCKPGFWWRQGTKKLLCVCAVRCVRTQSLQTILAPGANKPST